MTFEIDAGGRSCTVTVERTQATPHQYLVAFDGRRWFVDAVPVGSDELSMIFSEASHGSHEVGFTDGVQPGEVTVRLRTTTLGVTVNGRRSRRLSSQGVGSGEQRVVSPMPGRVLRVMVSVGDSVAARQPLVVVEAMKMENELSTARAGRVKAITVVEGQSVEAGRLLVLVE